MGAIFKNIESDGRKRLLAVLFAETKKKGIDAEFLRDTVSQNIIAKRLSEATPQEIVRVLEHITQKSGVRSQESGKRYESSLNGLKKEICDIAQKRFGLGWDPPLNALCKRLGVVKWQWLDLRHAKAMKETLIRLEREGEYEPPSTPLPPPAGGMQA